MVVAIFGGSHNNPQYPAGLLDSQPKATRLLTRDRTIVVYVLAQIKRLAWDSRLLEHSLCSLRVLLEDEDGLEHEDLCEVLFTVGPRG